MSKFRVRTSFGESIKPVELTRGDSPSNQYSSLRELVSKRHELNNFQLKYVSPAIGEVIVVDAESLVKAIKDAELRQHPQLELRVLSQEKQPPVTKSSGIYTSSSSPAPATRSPSYSSSSPSPSYSSPAPSYNSPAHHASPAHASHSASNLTSPSGTAPVQGVLSSYTLEGDPNSANPEKVAVKAHQEDDHFLFVPQPAKYTSEVTVVLEASKLSFQSTTKHPDGRIFQFTQGFSLPFSTIPANTIHIQGHNIKITF